MKPDDPSFEACVGLGQQFDDEGGHVFKRGPKSAVKEGTIDYATRERQFAKALVVVGAPKSEVVKPAGLPIEIVPVEGPSAWRSGTLRFRVVCENKALAHQEVLAATRIHGLVDFTTTEMTVRAVTKVRPGAHGAMQNEYRRLLKQVLDQDAAISSPPAVAA